MEDIRIFIGTGPRFMEPLRALTYSITENCSQPERLHITPMMAHGSERWTNWAGQPLDEEVGRPAPPGQRRWVTPFSLFRYAIPDLCDFEGFAIYLDVDMVVLGDIVELWEHRQPGYWNCAPGPDGDCVAVIDCFDPDRWTLDKLKAGAYGNKHGLRRRIEQRTIRGLPPEWNHADRYVPSVTKLIHFTSMRTQPFRPYPEALSYEEHPDPGAVQIYRETVQAAS